MTTQDLLAALRWSAPPEPVDWTQVEPAVGRTYPAEFKEIADALSAGSFQTFLTLLHPARFGGPEAYAEEVHGYADLLRDEAEERGFPYPIYPDAGGVLPFAVIGFDWVIGWLTADDDPDRWPIILCDSHLGSWHVYPMSTSEFLRAVVTLPVTIKPIGYVAEAVQPPSFVGATGRSAPMPTTPDPDYWAGPAGRRPMIGPADAVEELRGLVEPVPVPSLEWRFGPSRLGVGTPADYRHLIDELGNVRVGPVTVTAPGGRPDFLDRYDALRMQVLGLRANGEGPPGTIWPEPRGAVKWAELDGGGSVCWLFTSANPDQWAVLVLGADLEFSVTYPMTASRFLLELATHPDMATSWGGTS
jgi:hypothetical protein